MIASNETAARLNIAAHVGAFEVAEVASSHGTDVHVSALLGRPCELHDAATFDPNVDAFNLVAEQRRRPTVNLTPGCAPHAYRIGGEVELIEVTRRGVRVWACGKFPDKVGEFIQPDRVGEPIAA